MKAYYCPRGTIRALVFSLDNMFIKITDFAPSIAREPEQYNYRDAKWHLVLKSFVPEDDDVDVTSNILLKNSIQLNQPEFNRIFIKTLFV